MKYLLIVLGVVILWVIYAYNRLIQLTNRSEEAWSDIDVQLKRRYDLIPNLVETAKAYMAHERQTLEAVIAARNANAVSEPRDAEAVLAAVDRAAARLGVKAGESLVDVLVAIHDVIPDDVGLGDLERRLIDLVDEPAPAS